MSDRLSVTVFPNGPIKVSNVRSLKYCGEPMDAEGDVFLCRCGQSSNAPFCDGTHNKVGFDGSAESTNDKDIHVWEGQTLRTFFNPNTCMHALYCKPLKALRERELAGETTAADEIMKVIATCPSGALTFETKAAIEPPPEPDRGADIEIMEGGEVRLQTAYEINAELPERMYAERGTLCRCGLSRNKPWCDGQHKKRTDFR